MTARIKTNILGILNLSDDSFSDGGRYREPAAALEHARRLVADGACAIDVGAAASNPEARAVEPAEEIRRIDPVLQALQRERIPLSIDSWKPEVQRYACKQGVAFINDIRGFGDAAVLDTLAAADCRLIVMHAVQPGAIAERSERGSDEVLSSVYRFFDQRVRELLRAGISEDRLVLDPGMGFFLSSAAEASFAVLSEIPRIKSSFGLPLLISVSRKSFLGAVAGRGVGERGAATLAAEIAAVLRGVDYVRTHEVAPLADAIAVLDALPT